MRIRDPQTGHRSRAGRSTRSRSGGTRAEVRSIPHLPSIQRQPTPPQTDYQTVSFAILEKKTAHAAEQDRPDLRNRREAWFEGQLDLDPERLIFIDETPAFAGAGSGLPPTWPGATGGLRVGDAFGSACR